MPRQRLARFFNPAAVALALAVIVADLLTKAWARKDLARHAVHVWWIVWLRLRYNEGVSFSFNHAHSTLTTVITIVVVVLVVIVGVRAQRGLPTWGFGLLMGGGLANVVDRVVASPHRVTDFIAVSSFPVFNLADASVTFGFVLLLIAALRGKRLVAW